MHLSIIVLIMSINGADINIITETGWTLLRFANKYGGQEIVNYLTDIAE